MSKMIEEKSELTKIENGYKYHSYGIIELSNEDFDKNTENLIRNTQIIKDYLNKYDMIVENNWNAKLENLNKELAAAKEAYDNYDTSVAKLIEDINSKKEEKRDIIKMYIEGFEELVKKEKDKMNKLMEQQKKQLEFQLKNDEPMLEIYRNADSQKVDEKMEQIKKEIEEKNKPVVSNGENNDTKN